MSIELSPTAPPTIRKLPQELVNRIAAGEVIERPASVVKELVENALDAGAKSIIVDIEDGGRELIRIVDDGCGIAAEQLPLAFDSHATSKLTCDDDLMRIATMGFRGEALASIGSVAQARILSRPTGQAFAAEISNRGGSISEVQSAAGNTGTTIEVRHLFFNVPARRKFLKGAQTELGHVQEALLRLAIPFPQVAFTLTHNGRPLLELAPADARTRMLAGWPEEFAGQSLPVECGDVEMRLTGIVGLPELARPTARYQYFYLNGRHIRDRFMQHALKEAYRGLTEPGRQPAAILMLSAPPADVDVNVHPTKVEVRWKDSGRVHALVLSGVRERLLGSDLAPGASFSSGTGFAKGASVAPGDSFAGRARNSNMGPESGGDSAGHTATPGPRAELRMQLADFFRSAPPPAAGIDLPRPAEGGSATRPAYADAACTRPSALPTAAAPGSTQPGPGDFTPATASVGHHVDAPIVEVSPGDAAELAAAAVPAIQLHNSYLVVQSDDGLLIIDQHALHERIIYEDLLARVRRGALEAQRLLIPPILKASAVQLAAIDSLRAMLARLGIEVERFGPDSVAVHSFPSLLWKLEPGEFVADLLERAESELAELGDEELLHEVLDMMSCKAAVKAGDPLSREEIAALLARRDLAERTSNCPHGRPTTLRLTLRDLEKQFKRTGF